MKDIIESRSRAIVRDQWCFGERMNRIGDPFEWVDGRQMTMLGQLEGTALFLQYLAMSGEIYETPKTIRPDDFDESLSQIRKTLLSAFRSFVPFASAEKINFQNYIESTATVKAQDYGFIKTYLYDLPIRPIQVDIGPGLGANAIYSTECLSAKYIAVDANPHSYSAQRLLFRQLRGGEANYFDSVDAETLQIEPEEIRESLNRLGHFAIGHIPTWNFDYLNEGTVDLVSATWVLNEVNPAGIAWLLFQSDRVLKEGGYFYIRDSEKLKPQRHNLNYDEALKALGYEPVARLNVRNRVDMHGIPRAYRKAAPARCKTFEAFFDLHYSRFAVTTHGGEYVQNVDETQ